MNTTTDMNNIPNISIVHAGVYSCSVVSSFTGSNDMYVIDSSVSNSADAIVNVMRELKSIAKDQLFHLHIPHFCSS